MNKKVLLTGISGYIGNHCAVELLKNGYSVRGSLRSLSKSQKVIDAIKKEIDPKDLRCISFPFPQLTVD